ncbi:hypothetical protein [Cupriavidus pampae]|uniref:Lipoprotein n=1 Tax=Cupriavidus pampae TaxID=659251 RepID=A0ABM8Y208_9BURK|nr:hypothetical protein [Cupriavidus pampae]CAG9186763.1 hypothetical protein LMG32289_06607 [Cupriavidus pampae]
MKTILTGMVVTGAALLMSGCAVYPTPGGPVVAPAPVYVGPPAVVVTPRPYYYGGYGYGGGYYGRRYYRGW